MAKYSVVVPVYNSENTLEELHARLASLFDEKYDGDFELVLVDDSSKDRSAQIMHELHEKDKRVKAIYMARNFGQHTALLCGMGHVSGDIVITMDDDLQHPPHEVEKLIAYLEQTPQMDVVCGQYESKKHSAIRNLGTNMTNAFTSYIFKKPKTLHLTSFRAMKRYVADALCKFTESRPRIGHMLLRTTNRIGNVTVEHNARQFGKSGYGFKRLVKDFFNNILYNSNLPLLVLGYVGVFDVFVSAILILYYLIRYLVTGYSVAGFATQVIIMLASSGLILLGQGIIGHYLAQIVSEAKKGPLYTIRDKEID
ncbi:MAG: glycosyltransferase family 2 protein [Clostridia bacterium]|nr:glycosyltransferase family 2 protein [Clostridia bacterium]